MTRRFAARVLGLSCSLAFSPACTEIPTPTTRDVASDAGSSVDTGDGAATAASSASSRCRVNSQPPTIGEGLVVGAIFSADTPATQTLLLITGASERREDGTENIGYQMYLTGPPSSFDVAPVDLGQDGNEDLATCKYCVLGGSDCTPTSSSYACNKQYRAVAGQARVVQMTSGEGTFWVELGNLELARIVSRTGTRIDELDRDDCMFARRLVLVGKTYGAGARHNCTPDWTPPADLTCAIVDTAAHR